MQTGTLFKRHGSWHLRIRVHEIGPDGNPRRREVSKKLARVCDDYRSPKDLKDLVDAELAKVNRGSAAEGSLGMAAFFDTYFLPAVRAKRRVSTVRFYSDTFDNHVRDRVGDVRLRDFQTVHAQRVLDDVDLSHGSLQRIKTTISAIFSHALRLGFVSGHNPVHESKPEGRRTDFEGAAYSLEDIEWMLSKLTGTPRVVIAVAAFTGLRLSELRGLQWSDYDGKFLYVRRSVWRTNVAQTKTPESKAAVPVIGPLRRVLDEHRRQHPDAVWMFEGAKRHFSLNLDNLTKREIRPVLGERFKGFHGFRRGLATVLFGLGVDAEVAKTILRHSDSAVTRKHYIILGSQREGAAAMKKLERVVAGQMRNSKKRS